jgi:predicted PurR-regulated permease PerM
MEDKQIAKGIIRALFQLLGLAIFLWVLYELQSIIIYFAIAAVIALVGRPISLLLTKRLKFNNLLATTLTIAILLGIVVGIVSLFVPLIVKQGGNLSLLNVEELEKNIGLLMAEITEYLQLDNQFWQQQLRSGSLFNSINLSAVPNFLNSIIGILGDFTIGLFSVLFISFFLLKDSKLLERILLTLVKDEYTDKTSASILKIKQLLSRYFIGLLIQIMILLVVYFGVLLLVGIPNAFVIAFLCALLNLIPYLGPIIGGVLMLLLTMTSNLDANFSAVILPKAIYVMIGFVVGQLIDNFFSQPFIFSNSVKSHPLEIFIVILATGTLFGPMGMILAIPAYTALKVVLKIFLSDNKIVKSVTKRL